MSGQDLMLDNFLSDAVLFAIIIKTLIGQSAIRGYFRRNTHKLFIRYIRCAPQTR